MARPRSRARSEELTPQADPRAVLDGPAFLRRAAALVRALETDLLERAKDPAIAARLAVAYAADRKAERTGDVHDVWLRAFVTQVAVAWVLSAVFVRVLEDRGLVPQPRLAGPGAMDAQKLFFEIAPSLTERDYLRLAFRELEQVPSTAALFDAEHNPVHALAPSAEGSKALLRLFREPAAETPAFRFGGDDTRFLGDLYQDLSESVREKYALLQTPDFIERYILRRTLDRAIERFGLDATTIIDPTCGSGHFLLGAFARLVDERSRREPNEKPSALAAKALDAIAGCDINPYAVAIARFRLTLAYLDILSVELRTSDEATPSVRDGRRFGARLREVSPPRLHLAVADSLLFNVQRPQQDLSQLPGQSTAVWWDPDATARNDQETRDVLGRTYAAVVGNPPFIAVADTVLRDRYRDIYPRSAAGKYTLSVPFIERFFQLAQPGGYVGLMNSNAFMKRSFGKRVIEDFLASVDLDGIVNTAGVPIPGPSIQTVLLFGRMQPPTGGEVDAVLHRRGDPQSADPENGIVWQSIKQEWTSPGFENEFITVTRIRRELLNRHPWSLGGGAAADLKEALEQRGGQRLSEVVESIGIASFTLEDDVFLRPREAWARLGVPEERLRPMIIGEAIRDWTVGHVPEAFYPYDDQLAPIPAHDRSLKALWPHRTNLANNKLFGGITKVQGGLAWYEYGRFSSDKLRTPLSITYAEVATHNHFVLDRGGKVFKQTAPIIKLKPGTTEHAHLALLAYLNSSTACFWFKQVTHQFGTSTHDVDAVKGRPEANRFSFAATTIEPLPLPPGLLDDSNLADLARRLGLGANRVADLLGAGGLGWLQEDQRRTLPDLDRALDAERASLASTQNALDHAIYGAFGLTDDGEPTRWIGELELPVHKRLWSGRQGVFGHSKRTTRESLVEALLISLQERLEQVASAATTIVSWRELIARASEWRDPAHLCAVLDVAPDLPAALRALGSRLDAVPYLAAFRYTDTGLENRAAWERTWELQRKEDAGTLADADKPIPVPPRYDAKDFRDPAFFRLRGKLDVPKERFISYPGCESDEDNEPVYGWAGWNHLQQAQALAALYETRKTREGWTAGPQTEGGPEHKLTPMLAGLLELIPWVKQWHDEPDEDFGGLRMGQYFDDFLAGELRTWGLTRDDLRAWRPVRRSAARKAAATRATAKKTAARKTAGEAASDASPPRRGGRMPSS